MGDFSMDSAKGADITANAMDVHFATKLWEPMLAGVDDNGIIRVFGPAGVQGDGEGFKCIG